ncbi:sigma-70 family RNA polymerase sigma factor [Allorhodopirellula solitaria]|uniref:sigma-70 family RNA polymerase sigma factor n=1 Tax=Allorhodopirellula solitaria TaxID=2527987 RepID=UPI001647875E|nr:sigma-70 family RNA polymerase sigma factor [Allorhodopirellula solitaria]
MSDPKQRKADRFIEHLVPIQQQLTVYCRRLLRQPDEASDVLQSAVAVAFRDFDKYAEGTNFRAWMYRYVTLETLNRNRAFDRSPLELRDHDPPHQVSVETLLIDQFDLSRLLDAPTTVLDHCDSLVMQGVNELPQQQREIFLLRAIGDFKYREIAEMLNIPMGTVMGLLSRARIQLREHLMEYARQNGLFNRGERA